MQTLMTGVFGLIFVMLGFTLVAMFLVGIDWFLFDGRVLPKIKAKMQKICDV